MSYEPLGAATFPASPENLPPGWRMTTLSDHTRHKSGNGKLIKGRLSNHPATGLFPAFSASGQDVWAANPENEGTAIIVSAVGARCGKAFFAEGRWSAIANTHIVWPGDTIDARYLWRVLNNENFWVKGGSAQPFVKTKATFERAFPLPPLSEQRRIVAQLEALEVRSRRARAKLAEVPAQLAQARLSLLATAFRGGLTADWRKANPEIQTLETTLQRVRFESSRTGRSASDEKIPGVAGLSVGDIGPPAPNGWLKLPLLSVARLESGHTPSREHPEYWGGDVPWISIPDARRAHGQTIESTASFTNALGLENSAARLLPAGTVCLSRTASVGYVTVMGKPMATSQDFANWLCSEALVPQFLMMAFLAEGEHLLSFGRGSTHTTIYYPELKALHISLPPVAEQHEIVRRLNGAFLRLNAAAAAHATAVANLDHLDQSLLARAFSGGLVPQHPNEGASISTSAKVAQSSPIKTQLYLIQFIPALLRAAQQPLALDRLNAIVALLFLPPGDLLPLIEKIGGAKARAHFTGFAHIHEDGAFLAAINALKRTKTLVHSTNRQGLITLSLGPKLPPISPEIDADARHLSALISSVPSERVAPSLARLQTAQVQEAVLSVV
ncbi:hypothetical protein CMV30_12980 [Nibricoccus aquaticus]|uniref:Type I restriction modification DNA specificity domain-containing protein n=1 Tax=Nibricoccus aquaticus TaxID=2576891 RepID=A0A290QEV8_9BACT|nr:restriction endonuclease subunit S [Nibricoccus aquaticus]ATC64806.1 hypothetical protein CMV30_12980 [Nibricoccus aquaticus]